MHSQDIVNWETVLLGSYAELSKEPPASETLNATIPESIRCSRAVEEYSAGGQNVTMGGGEYLDKTTDEEMKVFLSEWTNASKLDIDQCFENQKRQEKNQVPGVPHWVQDR